MNNPTLEPNKGNKNNIMKTKNTTPTTANPNTNEAIRAEAPSKHIHRVSMYVGMSLGYDGEGSGEDDFADYNAYESGDE